jgi:hypothetical protein
MTLSTRRNGFSRRTQGFEFRYLRHTCYSQQLFLAANFNFSILIWRIVILFKTILTLFASCKVTEEICKRLSMRPRSVSILSHDSILGFEIYIRQLIPNLDLFES